MAENKKHYDVHGKAYAEDKDAFIRTFVVTARDEDDHFVELYAIHQVVCGDGRQLFESICVFGEDFWDDGVLAHRIDANCRALDDGDFDIILHELVLKAIMGKLDWHDETTYRIDRSIEYRYTNDGGSDEVKHATWYYAA